MRDISAIVRPVLAVDLVHRLMLLQKLPTHGLSLQDLGDFALAAESPSTISAWGASGRSACE
jgi:hypothetical protein